MILLKTLKIKNFLSHTDTSLTFKKDEHLLIDGRSGSGKSSIVEAIVWCLYNVGRVQNRSLIKRGKRGMEVNLYLIDDRSDPQNEYWIKRSLTSSGKHEISVFTKLVTEEGWKEVPCSGTKNLQSYIENNIIKCSYSLFINSVCYPQENTESFVRQTPSRRKDLILELIQAQNYEEYSDKAKEEIAKLNELLASAAGKFLQMQDELENLKQEASKYDSLHDKNVSLNEEFRTVQDALNKFNEEEIKIASLKERIVAIDRELFDTNNQSKELETLIVALTEKIKKLRAINDDLVKEKVERLKIVKNELTDMEQKIKELYVWRDKYTDLILTKPQEISYSMRINELNRQIEMLRNRRIGDEECPHCKQTHSCALLANEIKQQIGLLESNLILIGEEQRIYQEKMDDFRTKMDELLPKQPKVDQEKLISLQTEMRNLEPFIEVSITLASRQDTIKQLNEEITKYTDKLKILNSRITDLTKQKLDIENTLVSSDNINKKILLRTKADNIQSELWEIGKQLSLAENARSRIVILEKNMSVHNDSQIVWKEKLDDLTLLKEAFGTNGIKAIVIDYVLPQLENRINAVLQPLSDFRVRFDTQKSKVDGEGNVEGLFISVLNELGEEFDYDSYSGGEKIKILFAITEGLAQLQKIGFRLLDEAVVGLDDESGDRFANAILDFKEHFKQLICISHINQIKDLFEQKVTVYNHSGVSTVE
ncbi:SMC family ATPase [Candidatus Dojkabacteria bacterium]|jgi:exonuclease SbcC|nr:SMC family ATPase [Candidatus Dojkabacteria bacterium]